MKLPAKHTQGASLLELLCSMGMASVVGVLIASLLVINSILIAKNTATNLSTHSLRNSIDQMSQEITKAQGKVALVTATGTTVSTGSAAGIAFDVLVGVPYVITHPGGTGLSATATSLTMTRTTNSSVSAPVPKVGEVLLLDGAPDVRLKIASVTAGGSGGATQTITLTLASATGKAIPWSASTVKTAHLIRRAAYVVVPSGGRNQLRYFSSKEGTTNYTTATGYQIVDESLGSATGDNTPFSSIAVGSQNFVKIALNFNRQPTEKFVTNKESNGFSTLGRTEFIINPRGW
jgi:hypothetical protein